MRELLKGIFECLDINSNTGLATEDSLPEMSPFQFLLSTWKKEKNHYSTIPKCTMLSYAS